jgi:hypothetical protein
MTVQSRSDIEHETGSDLTAATSAYQRELVPFRSAMIATERLPAELDARLMVERRSS